YWRRAGVKKPRFLSLQGAYHGDTLGAVSLGHIDLFHQAYGGLLFESEKVMAPYCYRCPFNRAQPERADARTYRKCHWECTQQVEDKFVAANRAGTRITALVAEPLMQGAAGMIPQPAGWLSQVAEITRAHNAHLICDEVMTAFGRTVLPREGGGWLLGSAGEGVTPDLAALAKGLTGGYLPMAATLTTQAIFNAFLGEYEEFKTFFHGHSYTGNQLGAAAAGASLDLLETNESAAARTRMASDLARELEALWQLPNVGDIRQVGLVAGIELVKDWRTRAPFEARERVGMRVSEEMARQGVLTRPIGNVIVLMPPFCAKRREIQKIAQVLFNAVKKIGSDPARK
ncbi:MAG TPA: aminotransferase class III-fold pyridoxal phosphate-dependent enzyme, partial [Verrucomicrobiae bacterium]|nr:aminotransferase class III-fold pyridoxal phosphate-dependent enzyme [Verrucomicrobiae bacterium]